MNKIQKLVLCAFAVIVLVICLSKTDYDHAQIDGRISTNQDVVALFRISDAEFDECLIAYNTAKQRSDSTSHGFMNRYWAFTTIEDHAVPCENRAFRTRLPHGKYVMAIADGDHGFFLPLHVTGDVSIDFDREAAAMTR